MTFDSGLSAECRCGPSIRGRGFEFRANRRPSAGAGRRGITLLELTITVLLMGIVAATAAPRFASTICRRRADSAARRIAADLELIRNAARVASSPKSVTFNISNNTYSCSGVADPAHPAKSYTVRLSETLYPARLTVVSMGGSNVLSFDGYGSPDRAATITVASGSFSRSVVVNSASGTISVP
jgi:Tfp pilus assembly protein FimT